MNEECDSGAGCQISDLFRLLSQSHMLTILHSFMNSQAPLRFVALQESLDLSPNTLSARLKSLVEAGLLSRTPHNTIPPRVDYEATAKARDLTHVFIALRKWAGEHTLEPVIA